ncbi:major facilitator superfamily domain-containing protein [Limtongia smithiae]|uniref:major facilitator superfamily domain-containing protein n=1 Tax=Limtongia smithiae TaxID=1125753 RepID=UPI0034CD85EB
MSSKRIVMRFTKEEEYNVIRKIDRNMMPLIVTLFILAFLDRSNIGNARIAGLQESFNMSSNQFDWLLTAFYISYISFEWVGFLWNVVPAHIYVTMCLFFWGFVASLQSVSFNYFTLLVLRFFLGIGEASFGPGVPTYLSFFYLRKELCFRTGCFMAAAPLSTAFAGIIAYMITGLADKTPIDSWRVLLFVEGIPCMLMAVIVWNYLPDRPGTAMFLNLKDKIIVRARYRRRVEVEGEQVSHSSHSHGLKWDEAIEVLQDPKVYVTAAMFFLANIAYASLPVFLPLILRDMGYDSIAAQGLSVPPYLVAFCVVLISAYLSDKHKSRAEYIVFHASIAATGYLVLAISRDTFTRYLAIFFVTSGFFSVVTIVIAWTVNNQSSESAKGTGMVMLNTIGQCGPLIGTRLYPETDAPYYEHGMIICCGAMLLVAILAIALRRHLAGLNAASYKEESYRLISEDGTPAPPSAADDDVEAYSDDEEDEDGDEDVSRYELISSYEARQLREEHGFTIDILDDASSVDSVLKSGAKLVSRKKLQKFKYIL